MLWIQQDTAILLDHNGVVHVCMCIVKSIAHQIVVLCH